MKEKDVALAMEACRHLEKGMPLMIELLQDFLIYTDYSTIQKPDFFTKALNELKNVRGTYLSELYFRLQEEYDSKKGVK